MFPRSRPKIYQAPLVAGNLMRGTVHQAAQKTAERYGYELVSYEVGEVAKDPYVLYDRFNSIAYQWPEDYIPHWTEVLDVCAKLTERR